MKPSTSDEITVRVVGLEGYNDLIAQHKGNVVLVDCWATWCPPCMQQFPHTVELSQELSDEGLVVVSVSLDYPEDKEKVLAFLKEKEAVFANVISKYGLSAESFEQFNIVGGAIPFYKLYGRAGILRHQFCDDPVEDVEAIDQMDGRIRELLSEHES